MALDYETMRFWGIVARIVIVLIAVSWLALIIGIQLGRRALRGKRRTK